MAVLQIISNRPGVGKTCLAGALSRRMADVRQRVAYYKPLSPTPEANPDVAFMSQILAGEQASSIPVPMPLTQPVDLAQPPTDLSGAQRQEVADNLARLDAEFDTVLVEWAAPVSLPGQPSLLLFGYTVGADVATEAAAVSGAAQALGDDLAGVIINGVPRHRRQEVEQGIAAALRERGLPVLGAIPEDREMLALTVQQLADYLGGRWVQEPVDDATWQTTWIDRFLIGGNIMDSGPNYFGRYPNQAVITRAARPDIQMASLMCDTKCLVLTGGEEPTEYIRVEAQKRGALLLLVAGNTLDTVESLGGLLEQANPYSEHKLARFAALMEQHLDGGLEKLFS